MKTSSLILGIGIGLLLIVGIVLFFGVYLTYSPEEPTPVDGGFSTWGPWSECPVTCGGSEQYRNRSCTNPAPKHKGEDCKGLYKFTQSCSTEKCPGHGVWSEWSAWGSCTGPCTGATQNRTRLCNNPAPEPGGIDCAPPSAEMRTCEDSKYCANS